LLSRTRKAKTLALRPDEAKILASRRFQPHGLGQKVKDICYETEAKILALRPNKSVNRVSLVLRSDVHRYLDKVLSAFIRIINHPFNNLYPPCFSI